MNVNLVLKHRFSCGITQEEHKEFKDVKSVTILRQRIYIIKEYQNVNLNFALSELLTFSVY